MKMMLVDIVILLPFAVTLLVWTRGLWKQGGSDLVFSGVLLAGSLCVYAYFYRFTALSGVPWACLLIGAGVAVVVAVVKRKRTPTLRAAATWPAVALCLAGVLFAAEEKWNASGNALLVIMPYRSVGAWAFDDARAGLQAEPFVRGIPEMIDKLVAEAEIADADKGFRLLFSAQPFPDYQASMVWQRREMGGNWYYMEKYDQEGWLCPAMFKYFKRAPKLLYTKAEAR